MKVNARGLAAFAAYRLIEVTRGRELAEHWAWSYTPFPVGRPSWRQIGVGLAMGIRLDFIAKRYQRRMDELMDQIRKP